MVSLLSLIAIVFTLLLVTVGPVVAVIVLYRRLHFSLNTVFVGAGIFLVFQMFTRIPALQLLGQWPAYQSFAKNNLLLVGLFLAVTAGLFEETGRWIGFRWLLKGKWSAAEGVGYGLGHGGFEAMGLIGLAYLNNLIISLLINANLLDRFAAMQGGQAAVQALQGVKDQLIGLSPAIFLVAGLERAMAVVVHIGLSQVVLMGVRRAQPIYWLYAVGLHTLLNFPLVLILRLPNGLWWTELYLLVCAVLAGWFTWREVKKSQTAAAVDLAAVS